MHTHEVLDIIDKPWSAEGLEYHNSNTQFVAPLLQACVTDALEFMPSSGVVVEIGAGDGYLAAHVADEHRQRYVQTELGLANSRSARARNPDVKTACARAQELPFQSESIGGVIARNVFDMVDTKSVIHELGRIVRPGGTIVHLRDHRPSLTWIGKNFGVGRTMRLIPHFNEVGEFMRYQVVKQKTLAKLAPGHEQLMQAICNPVFQDYLTGGDQADRGVIAAKLFCEKAAQHRVRLSPLFTEIMDKKLHNWLQDTGFETRISAFRAEADYPESYARSMGWPQDSNHVEKHSNGYTSTLSSPGIPKGTVRYGYAVDMLVATKQ